MNQKPRPCAAGLALFKKSFAEATQRRDENGSHNINTFKDKIKKPAALHEIDNLQPGSRSKFPGKHDRYQTNEKLRGRGRGQPVNSHCDHVPAPSVPASDSDRTASENHSASEIRHKSHGPTGAIIMAAPENHSSREARHKYPMPAGAKVSKVSMENQENNRTSNPSFLMQTEERKLNQHGRPALKYRRDQDVQLKQSSELENNSMEISKHRNKNTMSVEAKEAHLSHETKVASEAKEKLKSLPSSDGKVVENGLSSGGSEDSDHVSPLDKIFNMFKMYEGKVKGNNSSGSLLPQGQNSEKKKPVKQEYKVKASQNKALRGESHSSPSTGEHSQNNSNLSEQSLHNSRNKDSQQSFSPSNLRHEECDSKQSVSEQSSAIDIVNGLEAAVGGLSISEDPGLVPDAEVLILQEDMSSLDQESPSHATQYQEPPKECSTSHFDEDFLKESPVYEDESIDQEHQQMPDRLFSALDITPDMEVFSQSESEHMDSSQEENVMNHQAAWNFHHSTQPYHHYNRSPGFDGNLDQQKIYTSQYRGPNIPGHHDSAFYPQFYPSSSTPYPSYPGPQAFAARSSNYPSLTMPLGYFGSKESIDAVVNYLMAQKKRWENEAENYYGYCAPLEVTISVGEPQPRWYGSHRPFYPPGSCPIPPLAWPGPFPQYSNGSLIQTDPHSYAGQTVKSSPEQGDTDSYQSCGPPEAAVDCASQEDDEFYAAEAKARETTASPVSNKSIEEAVYLGEVQERRELSDNESGSCYSTANSEDIFNEEMNQDIPSDAVLSAERKLSGERDTTSERVNNTTEATRMDANGRKFIPNSHYLVTNSNVVEGMAGTPPFVRKQHNNVYQSQQQPQESVGVSSFLTARRLLNNWQPTPFTTTPSPTSNRTTHPLKNYVSTMPLSGSDYSSPSPSRKRKNMVAQDTCAAVQQRECKYSFTQPSPSSTVSNKSRGNASFTSELSLSPNSTSGSIYLSPAWAGVYPSPNSNSAMSFSPFSPTHDRRRNRYVDRDQRQRSRSRSLEYDRQSSGASISLENSPAQPGVKQALSSPRDSLVSVSPCDHFRGNLDRSDNWKKDFLKRSRSYNHTFIDSHCHIDFLYHRTNNPVEPFQNFIAKHSDSFPANYEGCVSVFCHPRTFINYETDGNDIINVVAKEKGMWITAGCHPKNATDFSEMHMNGLYRILKECPKIVALGEIGLDYSGKFSQFAEIQQKVFRWQLMMAINLQLPLVIHCRDADDDCLKILQETVPRHHKIHAHCFTHDLKMANRWMSAFPNLYLGLTPLITYRSAVEAIETAKGIPLERLLLETDAPYFLPHGAHLYHQNEKYSHPGLALYTAEMVAHLKGIPVDIVLKACRENTYIVYNI